MIFVGIGGNLSTERFGSPRESCESALRALEQGDITVSRVSPWFHSAPVPLSDQPWYVNAVAEIETALEPDELLSAMHVVEEEFGRIRTPGQRNEARTIDLDLLDFRQSIIRNTDDTLVLPHPRMHERAFVLLPLMELAPHWKHPVTGQSIAQLVDALPAGQSIERMGGDFP